ncbi:Glutathione S-transferase [Rhynchospora pubera]|uniref:Glutathione S-transferase n=1 Tax=Rhynchospora pubera TaxID=906938 RepID=A0AAV8CDZ0_9POAL|nr:Glutathione S-transferase [Rhynchospora pubera]
MVLENAKEEETSVHSGATKRHRKAGKKRQQKNQRKQKSSVKEVLPPPLTATSPPPSLFDGTTRLYVSYPCPFAQRTWIARNYKGLQEKIKLVAIDLGDRPAWYKEKVYPENVVPSLEHKNEVKGESLDLVKYIDNHFEGPPLLPDDLAKQTFAEELLAYCDSFAKSLNSFLRSKGDDISDAGMVSPVVALDKFEESLSRFGDGPFLLGRDFSLVDIAYVPFVERLHLFLSDLKKYDITKGRPKLTSYIKELNKIEAYTATIWDPQESLTQIKKKFENCPKILGPRKKCYMFFLKINWGSKSAICYLASFICSIWMASSRNKE